MNRPYASLMHLVRPTRPFLFTERYLSCRNQPTNEICRLRPCSTKASVSHSPVYCAIKRTVTRSSERPKGPIKTWTPCVVFHRTILSRIVTCFFPRLRNRPDCLRIHKGILGTQYGSQGAPAGQSILYVEYMRYILDIVRSSRTATRRLQGRRQCQTLQHLITASSHKCPKDACLKTLYCFAVPLLYLRYNSFGHVRFQLLVG